MNMQVKLCSHSYRNRLVGLNVCLAMLPQYFGVLKVTGSRLKIGLYVRAKVWFPHGVFV